MPFVSLTPNDEINFIQLRNICLCWEIVPHGHAIQGTCLASYGTLWHFHDY